MIKFIKIFMINVLSSFIINTNRNQKRFILIIADSLIIFVALNITSWIVNDGYFLNFDNYKDYLIQVVITISFLGLLFYFDLYHFVLRYAGLRIFVKCILANLIFHFILYVILFIFDEEKNTIKFFLVNLNLLIILSSASRYSIRLFFENKKIDIQNKSRIISSLILDTSVHEVNLSLLLKFSDSNNFVGFANSHKQVSGNFIGNHKVFNFDTLKKNIQKMNIDEIYVSKNKIEKYKKLILELYDISKVKIKIFDPKKDFSSTKLKNSLRNLNINDLLGRTQIEPVTELIDFQINGKVCLVTGAGGSIGSEICRQILTFNPKKIILLDINELGIHNIYNELEKDKVTKRKHATLIVRVLGNVGDKNLMSEIISKHNVESIFHAAAYKHVSLVQENLIQSIKNNILGTLNCASIASKYKVKYFTLISSDKAVKPKNYMGATKRICEIIISNFAKRNIYDDEQNINSTKFLSVRFGNVLGSSGSVIPIFQKQIQEGGPITIRHKQLTRYFMTIEEASQLVIQAGALAKGGEIFILDMGEPVKILDLAKNMIKLNGLKEIDSSDLNGDIKIIFTNLLPGEKIEEKLFETGNLQNTKHPKIKKLINEESIHLDEFMDYLELLAKTCKINDFDVADKIINKFMHTDD